MTLPRVPRLLWITPPSGNLEFIHSALMDLADVGRHPLAILYRRTSTEAAEAQALSRVCQHAGAGFFAQTLELAKATQATGVHLKESSDELGAAVTSNLIVGASRHDARGLRHAFAHGVDYCTLSPVFDSPGKGASLGLDKFAALLDEFIDQRTYSGGPKVLALGGILTPAQAASCIEHGAHGVATIRGLSTSGDVRRMLAALTVTSRGTRQRFS